MKIDMEKIVMILLMLISCYTSSAQNITSKDYLYRALETAKEDTSKIRLLISLQKEYATKNFDSSLFFINKASELSKKLKTTFFDFHINVGYMEYYYYNNNYKKAIEYALKNKDVAEKENDAKKMAKSYNNLAAIYNHFGLQKFGIYYTLKCLDISEKTKDSASFAIRNLTASNTYYELRQFDKAIEYANKAIRYGNQFNNPFAVMMGLNNLAASYSSLNMLDSAIYISEQQLTFAKDHGDIVIAVYALINLSYDNFKNGNFHTLDSYSKEIEKYKYTVTDSNILANIYLVKSFNYIVHKKFAFAKQLLDSGILIAKTANNADALESLYHTYAIMNYSQGNIKEGHSFFYKYDSIVNAENLNDLNFYSQELETKYNTANKEVQIKLQQTQLRERSVFNLFLIFIAVALLLLTILIYYNYDNRQKLQQKRIVELEKEKQLQATEAILKGQEDERSRIAKDLHDGLGGLLSSVKYSLNTMKENVILSGDNASSFTRSIDMLDSGIQELRRIAHNMMPENLVKFGLDMALKDYCKAISKSNVLQISYSSFQMENFYAESNVSITVYRVIQELIYNTIKHANASEIIVQLSNEDTILHVTVEDNGKGFDVKNLNNFKGAGWTNIHNRINYLKGQIDVQSSSTEGTSVNIEIPLT